MRSSKHDGVYGHAPPGKQPGVGDDELDAQRRQQHWNLRCNHSFDATATNPPRLLGGQHIPVQSSLPACADAIDQSIEVSHRIHAYHAASVWGDLPANARSGLILAYIDVFWILATVSMLAIGLLLMAKKTKPGANIDGPLIERENDHDAQD